MATPYHAALPGGDALAVCGGGEAPGSERG